MSDERKENVTSLAKIPNVDISICPQCLKRMERILAPGVIVRGCDAESFVEVYDYCAHCEVYFDVAHVIRAALKRCVSDEPEDKFFAAFYKAREDDHPTLVAAFRQLAKATLLGRGRPIRKITGLIELCPSCVRECEYADVERCDVELPRFGGR
jgi:hypothetical protein